MIEVLISVPPAFALGFLAAKVMRARRDRRAAERAPGPAVANGEVMRMCKSIHAACNYTGKVRRKGGGITICERATMRFLTENEGRVVQWRGAWYWKGEAPKAAA